MLVKRKFLRIFASDMILAAFGFLNVSILDVLDVLMIAFIIFFLFRWIRGTSAMNIFLAIALLYVVKIIVQALGMELMSDLMKAVLDVGLIALIVIFQPEIRHFLSKIGGDKGIAGEWRRILDRIQGRKSSSLRDSSTTEIIEAVKVMAEQKTGALIVFPGKDSLQRIIETGDRIDAEINRRLILNLFFKNSPLHDGAVVISEDRIVAARCTLPLTGRTDIPARFGMRHKAAIGITEESDAAVIVVSEETGGVSFIKDGQVRSITNHDDLRECLSEDRKAKESEGRS